MAGVSSSRLAAAALAACLPVAAQAVELVVYTALETDHLKAYAQSHRRANPDIDLKFVRDSNGAITARLLAEKANPRADVILGVAASSMEIFKAEGMLAPYKPRGFDQVERRFSDVLDPPRWVGMNVWTNLICYNARGNAPRPTRWTDLVHPDYRGRISMPSPVSSGTAFMQVVAWLQGMGEAKAWTFMDELHANVVRYTHSGSRPCLDAAEGDVAVGISFDSRGNDVKQRGAAVELVFPSDGLGWDIESSAIVRATGKLEAAQRFMDWVASRQANEVYARHYVIVAHKQVRSGLKFIPVDLGKRLAGSDFEYAARNRSRILDEWTRRYGAKVQRQ
jgi:iron(III) transport system substrate-binding protein